MNGERITWKSELEDIIRRKWDVGQTFTITDVYRYEKHFERLYPRNNYVRKKLQQTIQQLREDKIVEFVDYEGTYQRIK